jgi:hypothetical protein
MTEPVRMYLFLYNQLHLKASDLRMNKMKSNNQVHFLSRGLQFCMNTFVVNHAAASSVKLTTHDRLQRTLCSGISTPHDRAAVLTRSMVYSVSDAFSSS